MNNRKILHIDFDEGKEIKNGESLEISYIVDGELLPRLTHNDKSVVVDASDMVVTDYESDVEITEYRLDEYFGDVDWSKTPITVSVINLDSNVAPLTEYEYFQQIGNE